MTCSSQLAQIARICLTIAGEPKRAHDASRTKNRHMPGAAVRIIQLLSLEGATKGLPLLFMEHLAFQEPPSAHAVFKRAVKSRHAVSRLAKDLIKLSISALKPGLNQPSRSKRSTRTPHQVAKQSCRSHKPQLRPSIPSIAMPSTRG